MKQLCVAFRVDASLKIGAGHVMRCLTLADALHERGADCVFVCRAHIGNLMDLIQQRGYATLVLPLDESEPQGGQEEGGTAHAYSNWLGAHWTADADQTSDALANLQVDWLVIDHYSIDARWEGRLRRMCQFLLVIDDLANRAHDCDLLLDQNLGRGASDYAGLVNSGSTVLAGPQYALLRPDFIRMRPYSLTRRTKPTLKRLLVSMGGMDNENVTGEVLEALQGSLLPEDCLITVVSGIQAPWLEQVRKRAAKLPWKTEVLVNVSDMAQLMADSDLAIGAAGSSAWERCCLGLPAIVLVLAENQRFIGRVLHESGAAILTEYAVAEIRSIVDRIMLDPQLLTGMSISAAHIVDGLGTARVASRIDA